MIFQEATSDFFMFFLASPKDYNNEINTENKCMINSGVYSSYHTHFHSFLLDF